MRHLPVVISLCDARAAVALGTPQAIAADSVVGLHTFEVIPPPSPDGLLQTVDGRHLRVNDAASTWT